MIQLDKFIRILESEFPEDRLTYQKQIATFHPESSEDAAKLFKLANREKQPLFVTGFGNNIDPEGQPFTQMVAVRTDRLNELVEIVPDDFYVTAGSGYPLGEINQHLAAFELWFPHAGLPYVGSVGGAIAAGLSSTLKGHDFPLKRYLVKAEIVTPEGDIIHPGSVCFKSVSGYDIVKIFSGTWGLLGLLVSASFRIMPLAAEREYAGMKMKPVSRQPLLEGLQGERPDSNAEYSRKVKAKFDPNNILPVV